MAALAPPMLYYDPATVKQEFLATLETLDVLTHSDKARAIVGEAWLKQMRHQAQAVRARLEADFSLVVIGDFKRGKSTLVNALLGMPVVTTNITPETITINRVEYGPALTLEACLNDGGRIPLTPTDLNAETLARLLEPFQERLSHLSLHAPVAWLQQVSLVDTPGLGDMFRRFDAQVHAYLPRADALIYVISALSPLSQTERAFLQLSVLPRDFAKIFFVVNMLDAYSEADAARVLRVIETRLAGLFPNARVFGLSALDEVCRQQGMPRPNPARAAALEAAFAAFRSALEDTVLLNREVLQLDRAIAQTGLVFDEAGAHLSRLLQATQVEEQQLAQAIAACEDETSALRVRMDARQQALATFVGSLCAQSCGWMDEFSERLRAALPGMLSGVAFGDVQRHFHFFLTDALRHAMELCLDAHRGFIMERLTQAHQALAVDLAGLRLYDRQLSGAAGQSTFTGPEWGECETFYWLIDASLGGLLSFAGTLALKEWKDAGQVRSLDLYRQHFEAALPALKESVAAELRRTYAALTTEIQNQMEALYRRDVDAALEALRQAQTLYQQGQHRVAGPVLQEQMALLQEAAATLPALRQKVWLDRRCVVQSDSSPPVVSTIGF